MLHYKKRVFSAFKACICSLDYKNPQTFFFNLEITYTNAKDNLYFFNAQVFDTVERFSISNETWTQQASMSIPRDGLAAAVYDGKIFSAGGE